VCVCVCVYACILSNTCLEPTRVYYTTIGISIGFIRFRRAYVVRTTQGKSGETDHARSVAVGRM